MCGWIVYWVAVIAIAISSMLFIDFMISGIGMLVFLLMFANVRVLWERNDRIYWQNAAASKHSAVDEPQLIPAEVAMAYVHFNDGHTRTIMNLETDYKVGQNMKLYEKNKQHNRWDEIPNVASVEFHIYEMDAVIPKQR